MAVPITNNKNWSSKWISVSACKYNWIQNNLVSLFGVTPLKFQQVLLNFQGGATEVWDNSAVKGPQNSSNISWKDYRM